MADEKERARKYYIEHRDQIRKQRREHSKKYPEIARNRARRFYYAHQEELKEGFRKYAKENNERLHIQYLARRDIPLADLCEICGDHAEERHHPDYSRPLEVMHLCKRCHSDIHKSKDGSLQERA